jgi:MerR family redox-sensitive transcriptional activator SoxR
MTIGEVAKRAGLRTSAIRYYERLGLLPAPARASGRRVYRADVLLRLTVIRFARDSGFTLGEIRKLFAGKKYSAQLRWFAAEKVVELDNMIERARTMQRLLRSALRCECLTVEECGRRLSAIPAAGR